jgi:segregation and condensation protein B
MEKDSPVISRESVEAVDSEREVANIKKIEAALFIAGRFLSLKELISLTDVNPILIRKLLDDLADRYKDSGIDIVKKGDMWKMDVAGEYSDMVNRLATGSSEFSNAEQETLAIIAYKQPIKQSVVIKIRGNKAYDHIRNFVEAGLVNKKRMGHTSELTLTDDFHDYFKTDKKGES